MLLTIHRPDAPFHGMPVTLNGPITGLNYTGSPVRFYTSGGDSEFSWSLHGYPIGIIDTPGILVGESAFHFAFLSSPETTSKALGSNLMMDNWTFTTGRPSTIIAPAAGKFLGYNF